MNVPLQNQIQKSPAERLATPVQFLKGVGPQRAELLERLNLRFARDILFYFPRDYREPARLTKISQLAEDQPAAVSGVIDEIDVRNTGPGRSLLGVLLRQEGMYMRALWFNQPYMRDRLSVGQRVMMTGKPRFNGGRWEMVHPRVEPLDEDETGESEGILPVYPLTEGLNQWQMRKIVRGVVDEYAECLDEVLPQDFRDSHRLYSIQEALSQIHSPADQQHLDLARRRFIYQELFVLQLALSLRKRQLAEQADAPQLPLTGKIDARIRRLFPFELTEAQNQAIQEIADDMGKAAPMNRLLHGDVGSGKTVVAEYAMLLAVAHGRQAVIMAPTEVLARQHVQTLNRDLQASRVRIGLLTGSLGAAERRETLQQIAAGDLDLIVGTHALLQEGLEFSRLGLVVIDEQHKFGVRQRAALRGSGANPHYLVMTATPIPRTVSMTMFGDLDISTLRSAPPNRATVHTYHGTGDKRQRWWEFFRKKLREGRQGYVVAPQVEGGENNVGESVEHLYATLAEGALKGFRLGLLHGRMAMAEREPVMQSFREGRIQVLVATSVIEVGIDVPNATLMTIEGGHRFGLAQLHQLRGRVSRGAHPGYVCVFASSTTEESQRRIDVFCRSNDGFELAEVDFELRGPGDLFSSQQHGLPPFRIADLARDRELLEEARHDAQALAADADRLAQPGFDLLRRMVYHRYGNALELADVG